MKTDMKTVTIKDLTGIKVGDVITVPNSKDYRKTKRVKTTSFTICTLRSDDIHVRIGYMNNGIEHYPLIEEVLKLNPEIKQKETTVKTFIREGERNKHGINDKVYQECISLKGTIAPIDRPYLNITLGNGKPAKWYINN